MKQNLETSIQNAPLGNLKIINCRGVEQYYLDSAETRTSYPNGKYLRKSDFELAGKLAQRNYDEKLLSEVEKQLKNIQNIIKKYEKQEIVQVEELYSVYDRMSPSRKKMVDARIISDKEYVNQWSAKIYSGKDFAEGQAEIYTEKKERVRSKSEKIIADMLYHKNSPHPRSVSWTEAAHRSLPVPVRDGNEAQYEHRRPLTLPRRKLHTGMPEPLCLHQEKAQ